MGSERGPKTWTWRHLHTLINTRHRHMMLSCLCSPIKVIMQGQHHPVNTSASSSSHVLLSLQWRSTVSAQPQTWQRPARWWTATGRWSTRTLPLWAWARPSWSTFPWSSPIKARTSHRCSSGETPPPNAPPFPAHPAHNESRVVCPSGISYTCSRKRAVWNGASW